MRVIPSIDLLDGRVVRLRAGRLEEATVYSNDPAAVASGFEAAGAERIHVVDLDAAFDRERRNGEVIRHLLRTVRAPIQVAGGIRSLETVNGWFDAGAALVVLGTALVREPQILERSAERRKGRIIAAVDALDDRVRVAGWTDETSLSPAELAARAVKLGAAEVLYTDISRDGTRTGPNVEAAAALQRTLGAPVIASGGVGRLDDVLALARAGLAACIVGRALYEGTFSLEAAMSEARC